MSRNKKKRNQAGKAGIAYIVVFLLIIISAKIVMLYQKDQAYRERSLMRYIRRRLSGEMNFLIMKNTWEAANT